MDTLERARTAQAADVRFGQAEQIGQDWEDLKPRDVLTPGAFANAVRTVLAVGGSLNAVKHLQAVAAEAGSPVDVYGLFETLGPQTPVLAGVTPVGKHRIEEFEAAGGCRALMKQLASLMDPQPLTVTGRSVGDNLREAVVADAEVIRPVDRPVAPRPAIILLRGNVAPDGGLIKTGIAERKVRRFSGPAICFDTSDAAIAAIQDQTIQPGQVVVMRGAGACGGPAMGGGASRVVFAIDGAGLGDEVALLTDGHLSGLVCKGLVVAEVAPEAALGGPLALVRDGDRVTIDLDARRVDMEVADEEIDRRRAAWEPPAPQFDRGWLQIYRRNVRSLQRGAVLVDTPPAG